MRREPSLVVVLLLATGCATTAPPSDDLPPPGTWLAYASFAPGQDRAEHAAAMTGSCNFARPPGKSADYPTRLRAQGAPSRVIQVRVEAVFRGRDRSNVIGRIAPGTILYGRGSVKATEASPGIGYAVLVRDSAGRVCRGYVHSRFLRHEPQQPTTNSR